MGRTGGSPHNPKNYLASPHVPPLFYSKNNDIAIFHAVFGHFAQISPHTSASFRKLQICRVFQVGLTCGGGGAIWAELPKTAWKLHYHYFWSKTVGWGGGGRLGGWQSNFSGCGGILQSSSTRGNPDFWNTIKVFILFKIN